MLDNAVTTLDIIAKASKVVKDSSITQADKRKLDNKLIECCVEIVEYATDFVISDFLQDEENTIIGKLESSLEGLDTLPEDGI